MPAESNNKFYYECPLCHTELRWAGITIHVNPDEFTYYYCQNPNCDNNKKAFYPNNKPKQFYKEEFTPKLSQTRPKPYDILILENLKNEGRKRGKWIRKRKTKSDILCDICKNPISIGENVFTYSYRDYYKRIMYEHESCYKNTLWVGIEWNRN